MLLDVRPDHLKMVQDILQRFVPDREVWAFGSRAKWLAKEYSDLDLCVLGETPLSFSTLGLLEEAFDESDLPYKVDVVDWATTSSSFQQIIQRDKVVVQGVGRVSPSDQAVEMSGCANMTYGMEFNQIECQKFCIKVADGTHESPKQTQLGKRLATSKNIKDGQLNLDNAYLISIEDFDDINRRSKVEQWDILISMIGTVGEVCLVDSHTPDFAIKNVGLLKCKDKVHAKWLYYFFRSSTGRQLVEERKKGTTQQYISLGEIRRLPISVPSEDAYMREATDILAALDDRIALLRETNATLEGIAQALFKSWFVDFDPVHAKQQGIVPAGMDETTAVLFPDGFEESEQGLVPKGWKIGTLGDIAKTEKKQMQPSELHAELHYVGLEHIPRRSLSLTGWGNAERLESAKAKFAKGDILFGKLRPYFHKVVIAPFDGVCSTDILVCQSKNPAYFALVVMQIFSKTLIDYAERLSNGAKMPRVNWTDLANYPICIPPEALAAHYNEILAPIISAMTENAHRCATLSTLRDTLLPRLISGQLRLSAAMLDEVKA